MRTIYVLLNDVADFLAIDIVLFKKHVLFFIGSDIKNMIDAPRKKYTLSLAQTIWLNDVSHFFLAVGLAL